MPLKNTSGLPAKKLLTKKETADYLGVTYNMVCTLIKQEGFPVIRLGKESSQRPRVFIDREQLDQWLLTQSEGGREHA